MRSPAPVLLPIFRSALQAEILALLLLNPSIERTAADLARHFRVPVSTVHREVATLSGAGLLRGREVGRSVLLRADQRNRLFEPLSRLLLLTWGPQQVVAEEFADLPGASAVVVYGSWAARYLGTPGPPPNDLDVLVVGEPDRGEVYDAADRAERRLTIPVNPVIRSTQQWTDCTDALVGQIRSGPWVQVADDDQGGSEPGVAS